MGRSGGLQVWDRQDTPSTKLSHLGSPSLPAPLLLSKALPRLPSWPMESSLGRSSGLPQGDDSGRTQSREAP